MSLNSEIMEQVRSTLQLDNETIPFDANLIEYGLHSLAIMQMVDFFMDKYSIELSYVDFAMSPTINEWCELILNARDNTTLTEDSPSSTHKESATGPITQQEITGTITQHNPLTEPVELSEMQYAYWAGRQSENVASHLYIEFFGTQIDIPRLNHAFTKLLKIHPMLRVVILDDGHQKIAQIDPNKSISVDDLQNYTSQKKPSQKIETFLQQKRARMSHQKLNLGTGQTLDLSLTLLPENTHRLHIDIDMIAADPRSILMLIEDLSSLYQDPDFTLPEQGMDYFEYLHRTRQDQAIQNKITKDKAWWNKRLNHMAPPPQLPIIPTGLRTDPYSCDSISQTFSKADKTALQRIANTHHLSLSSLLLTLFSITIATWSVSKKFRLNLPIFDRSDYAHLVEHVVGDFSKLLILNVALNAEEHLIDACQRIEQEFKSAREHASYSGIQVLRDLSKHTKEPEVAPIVYTCGLDCGEIFSQKVKDSLGQPIWCVSQGPTVDLDVQIAKLDGGLFVNWDIRTGAFKEQVIYDMFDRYVDLIRTVIDAPEQMLAPIQYPLPLSQYKKRYAGSRQASLDKTSQSEPFELLHQRFFKQAESTPENIAIASPNGSITYQALAQQVNSLAQALLKQGVQAGDSIAFYLANHQLTASLLLAALSVGALYYPIASSRPKQEVMGLLKTQQCQILVTDSIEQCDDSIQILAITGFTHEEAQAESGLNLGPGLGLCLGLKPILNNHQLRREQTQTAPRLDSPNQEHVIQSPAYVIQSSDPDSQPQTISHATISNTIDGLNKVLSFDQKTSWLSLSSVENERFMIDLFTTLLSGNKLLLIDNPTHKTRPDLENILSKHQVNTIHGTTTQISELFRVVSPYALSELKLALCGHARVPFALWQKIKSQYPKVKLIGLNGMTEAGIYSTYQINPPNQGQNPTHLPTSKTLPGVNTRIVDPHGNDCPNWVMGELWVATKGEASNWFKTDSPAFYNENAEIVSYINSDQLIKRQGHFIDLEVISSIIYSFSEVIQTQVMEVEYLDTMALVAFIVTESSQHEELLSAIKSKVEAQLPHYLLPKDYLLLDSIPLTAAERIDSNALRQIFQQRMLSELNQHNSSALERATSYIFSKIIGLDADKVSLDDDFFDSGGDSMLATHLVTTMSQYFKGCQLSVVDIFVQRTPRNIAKTIEENIPKIAEPIAEVFLNVVGEHS